MGRKISINYGLVSIAARVETAVDKPLSFKTLCTGQVPTGRVSLRKPHEPVAIKQPQVCPSCGPVVERDTLHKGIAVGDAFQIVDTSEIADDHDKYVTEHKGKIDLVPHSSSEFLGATAPGDSINYLVPEPAAANHYQLLVRLIQSHPELAFVGLHTPLTATALFRVFVRDGVLVMEKRVREESMRPTPSVDGVVNDKLYEVLNATIDTLVTPYSPDAYEDHYAKQVAAIIDGVTPEPAAAALTGDDALLAQLQALQASL